MKELLDGQVITLAELEGITRRDLCRSAAFGLIGLGLAACGAPIDSGSGGEGGQSGQGGDGGQGGAGSSGGDGGSGGSGGGSGEADAGGGDGGSSPACGAGVVSTGKMPSDFATGMATYFSAQKTFVARDDGGLFALTAVCTHQGATITFVASGKYFNCPRHGSHFSLVGAVTKGPATKPLRHDAMCLDEGGKVAFDVKTVVDAATRLAS